MSDPNQLEPTSQLDVSNTNQLSPTSQVITFETDTSEQLNGESDTNSQRVMYNPNQLESEISSTNQTELTSKLDKSNINQLDPTSQVVTFENDTSEQLNGGDDGILRNGKFDIQTSTVKRLTLTPNFL